MGEQTPPAHPFFRLSSEGIAVLEKHVKKSRTGLTASVCLLLLLGAAGCGEPEVEGFWLDREVVVDGSDDEWGGFEVYRDEMGGTRLSTANDGRYLYLCLSTRDPAVQGQALGNGLMVWLDPRGGKDRSFGINYPMRPMTAAGETGRQRGEGPAGPGPGFIRSLLDGIPGAMEIVGPGDDMRLTRAVEEASALGIEAALGLHGGILVYELKVPLERLPGRIYAVGSEPGKTVGIGFVTGRTESSSGERPDIGPPPQDMDGGGMRGGGMRGGGMPGGGMGMPGGMGGGRGGPGGPGKERGARPQRLEAWIRLVLASEAP